MNIYTIAIILGIIGLITSIILTVYYASRKIYRVDFKLPEISKESEVKIIQGRISGNVMVGDKNSISVSSSRQLSDQEIKGLVDNISVKAHDTKSKE
jgi:hypothetical protein